MGILSEGGKEQLVLSRGRPSSSLSLSHYVAQAGPEVLVLVPQPPEIWGNTLVPPCPDGRHFRVDIICESLKTCPRGGHYR